MFRSAVAMEPVPYVGPLSRADYTVNVDPSMSLDDIQLLIDDLPHCILGPNTRWHQGQVDYAITIQFADGTYYIGPNALADLNLSGFYGGGQLILNGNPGEDPHVRHTNQAVILVSALNPVHGVVIQGCSGIMIHVKNMQINVQHASASPVSIYRSSGHILFEGCYFYKSGAAGAGAGVSVRRSHGVQVGYSNFYGAGLAGIEAIESHVYSIENDDSVVQPSYGLDASGLAVIGKFGAQQPAGSVANERARYGGVIR